MEPSSRILNEFRAFCELSEEMIAGASKTDLAETARILAVQVAHYARKHGEMAFPDLAYLFSATTTDETDIGLLRDGMAELVCVLVMVTDGTLTKTDAPIPVLRDTV